LFDLAAKLVGSVDVTSVIVNHRRPLSSEPFADTPVIPRSVRPHGDAGWRRQTTLITLHVYGQSDSAICGD